MKIDNIGGYTRIYYVYGLPLVAILGDTSKYPPTKISRVNINLNFKPYFYIWYIDINTFIEYKLIN